MPFSRTIIGQHTYTTVLDNHEPPRSHYGGVITEWAREEEPDSSTMVLEPGSPFMEIHEKAPGGIGFVLDDGKVARPYYVSGWQPKTGEVFLQAFPTNPNGRVRSDNGRVIDYGMFVIGPRKTYHLKTTPIT